MHAKIVIAVTLVAGMLVASHPPGADASTGLIAHWEFEAVSDDAVSDSSPSGYDGTMYGAVATQGPVGSALAFDGVDDDVWIPNRTSAPPAGLATLQTGSVAVWVRYVDDGRASHPVFYLGDQYLRTGQGGVDRGGHGLVIEIGHEGDTKLYVTTFMRARSPVWCFDTALDLEPDRWYHFIAVVGEDFNTGYLDGVELTDRHYNYGDATNTEFFGDFQQVDRLSLGSGLVQNAPAAPLAGALDDVRIYDRALTAEEAYDVFSGALPPDNLPPIAVADEVATEEGTTVEIDVLANDHDPDGDPLVVQSVSEPLHGTSSTNGSTVSYTPAVAFTGSDGFTYTVADPSGAVAIGSVTVTVGTPGVTEPPSAPTGLIATVVTASSVDLAWTDTSSGNAQEDGFELQRSNRTIREPWQELATVATDATAFTDDSVAPATNYFYRIRAVNELGASPWSRSVRVTTSP